MALVGQQFTSVAPNEVLGIRLSLKFNTDLISIWHRNSQDKAIVEALKKDIVRLVPVDETSDGNIVTGEDFKMKIDYMAF